MDFYHILSEIQEKLLQKVISDARKKAKISQNYYRFLAIPECSSTVDYCELMNSINTGMRCQVGPALVEGDPDRKHISSICAERQNLTMQMQTRGFTRLTN